MVLLHLSGFGQTGPSAFRPANGMTMEPASGVPTVTGYRGEGPTKTGQTWVDPYSGLHGAAALLAALIHRDRTGEGQIIDVSMLEATLPVLESQLADYQRNGRHQERDGKPPAGDGARRLPLHGPRRLGGDLRCATRPSGRPSATRAATRPGSTTRASATPPRARSITTPSTG